MLNPTDEDQTMTSIKEKDYEHGNRAGTGPAKKMVGGDLTDDIDINNPDTPEKKRIKTAKAKKEKGTH
jgi:hypothetical protein